MNIRNKINNIYLPFILSIILVFGIFIGLWLHKNNTNNHFFIYPKTNKINTVLNYIENEYVDSVSKEEIIEKAIPNILENLDPHSVYIPAINLQQLTEPLEGNFEGIGIEFNMQKDTAIVVNTISGGPSERVGLMAGDRIVKINDTIVAGISISTTNIIRKLKGKRGSKVKVDILRKKLPELISFTITRDKIPLYSVDVAYMITDEIGYIKISRFARTTFEEFMKGIEKLEKYNCNKIIIDLRGNGGGYMDAATNIANQFLNRKQLIVYTKGKSKPRTNFYANAEGICLESEVMILIDEWSASASEILAGAIQDNDRGLIIGRRSFGKGLVQEQTIFNDGSALRLTTARYYTPTGRCIQKPYNSNTSEYFNDINNRYNNGEFGEVDSIRFSDSLKFITPNGNIVYGGGGIMPDIFIPLDTSGITHYYRKIISNSFIYQFAFDYADQHRQELNKFSNYNEINQYLDNRNILKEFSVFASKNGVPKDINEFNTSKNIIYIQLKAYIVRNIIGNEGYYSVQEEIDHTLQKSIEIFSNTQTFIEN